MTRLQIILSRQPPTGPPASPSKRSPFWRLKSVLLAIVLAAAAFGMLLAAIFLGSVIAAFVLLLGALAVFIAGLKLFIWRLRQ